MTRLAAALLAVLAGGCLDSVVSAECAETRTECGGQCVDLESDRDNCGACGVHCEGACVLGECRAAPAGRPIAGRIDEPGADPAPDAGPVGPADGGAVDPADGGAIDPADGGAIDPADGGATDPDAAPGCVDPLQECGGVCVDVDSDPAHCGACGHACISGLCTAGECQDGIAGHVIVIGHDFRASHAALARVLGNAVFLAPGAPVRVATYAGLAEEGAVARTRVAITGIAAATGRSWQELPVASAAEVPGALADADVLLVHSQTVAGDGELATLGALWSAALIDFAAAGGVIVVLDGGGANGGTHQVLEPAGLFSAGGITPVTGQVVEVGAPADGIAVGVPLHYLAPDRSVAFATASPAVVSTATGQPVVVHRAIYSP